MPEEPRISKMRESIKTYEEAIATFETARSKMQQRRHGASDSVMVHLDESLKLNQRTLESLQRVLQTAKDELDRASR
jgi:uncharacterized protein YukE